MFSKMRKMLRKQEGFTLIELMTVLIILGVILGIGVPKYISVQKQAKHEADAATLQSMARVAETYAVTWHDSLDWTTGENPTTTVTGQNLISKDLIVAEDFKLNSEKDITGIGFTLDAEGRVTNLGKVGDTTSASPLTVIGTNAFPAP